MLEYEDSRSTSTYSNIESSTAALAREVSEHQCVCLRTETKEMEKISLHSINSKVYEIISIFSDLLYYSTVFYGL